MTIINIYVYPSTTLCILNMKFLILYNYILEFANDFKTFLYGYIVSYFQFQEFFVTIFINVFSLQKPCLCLSWFLQWIWNYLMYIWNWRWNYICGYYLCQNFSLRRLSCFLYMPGNVYYKSLTICVLFLKFLYYWTICQMFWWWSICVVIVDVSCSSRD